jgi:CheY-like chemotaxis protein
VLLNLVGNALEAVRENGMVHISTENCRFTHPLHSGPEQENGREYVKLIVADNGPGIGDEHLNHIFNPFYSTKVMGKSGTGLGLSVVWNIVQEHDGWIEVKGNAPGAVFEVYLPATHDQVCYIDLPVKVVGQGKGERILIVDDQAEQNEVLENALSNLGYATFSVTSGEAAIEFLKSEPVDLLLMDMIMGNGLNGRETLEIILQNHPGQRAIVVSGYAKREEIERTKALGVSLFVEKPVTLSRISSAIQQSLVGN